MAIQNLTGLNEVLKNHSAKDWMKTDSTKNISLPDVNPLSDFMSTSDIADKKSFSEILATKISGVNNLQQEADVAIQKLVSGKSKNIHETMLAVEKAEIAYKTMNQIRLKVIDAYKEMMRMQV